MKWDNGKGSISLELSLAETDGITTPPGMYEKPIVNLGGGYRFKDFLFSPLFGEDSHFA